MQPRATRWVTQTGTSPRGNARGRTGDRSRDPNIMQSVEWAGKPDSVPRPGAAWAFISLRRPLPVACSGQPGVPAAPGRHRCRRRSELRSPPPRTLTPYLALLRTGFDQPACHHAAGALLPHLFTLTPSRPLGERERAVWFLCHFPSDRPAWVLPSVLPCGVRTFLGPSAACVAKAKRQRTDRERLAHSATIITYACSDVRERMREWRGRPAGRG